MNNEELDNGGISRIPNTVGARIPNMIGIPMAFGFPMAFGSPVVFHFEQNGGHFVQNHWNGQDSGA